MPAKFQVIRYGHLDYGEIPTKIMEVAAHFDVAAIHPHGRYSLHTEYSYGPRRFDHKVFQNLHNLRENTILGIPQLWYSEDWANEFLDFILSLIHEYPPPEIVEIHPPFVDYCPDIASFLMRYSSFEKELIGNLPDTQIFIENRTGSQYRHKFLVENGMDLSHLLDGIADADLRLKLVLDIPALFSSMKNLDEKQIALVFESMKKHNHRIGGIHIWGHDKRPHMGSLDSLFAGDSKRKDDFLKFLSTFFDDGIHRYLVPEVNGTKQIVFDDICNDLKENFDLL